MLSVVAKWMNRNGTFEVIFDDAEFTYVIRATDLAHRRRLTPVSADDIDQWLKLAEKFDGMIEEPVEVFKL